MKDKLTGPQTEAILKALDEAVESGPWEASNFLRVIGKNLREIRDDLAAYIANNNSSTSIEESAKNKSLKSDQREVFIALYSTEGNYLQSWERIIANLQRQMVSRPIYADEENLRYLIKTKENKVNEAYVAIVISEDDILAVPPDKTPRDKFGKPLLSLKDRSLNLENISRFVHVSGIYHYVKGRLVKTGA